MNESFLTILSPATGEYKVRGSKFLAFAYPVKDEEEIKCQVASLKKIYHDARHHCFAWILGADGKKIRAFDDGEPNHSAGDPILGQIKSRNLTNVLVVVVRYFGGTKLGISGLTHAYRVAAAAALLEAKISEERVMECVQLIFPYEYTTTAMRLVNEYSLEIVSQHYEEQCYLKCYVPVGKQTALINKVNELSRRGQNLTIIAKS